VVCQKRTRKIPKMVVCKARKGKGLSSVTSQKIIKRHAEIITGYQFNAAEGDFIAWSPTVVLA